MSEISIVSTNLSRAKSAGREATLTVKEWLEILDRFNWKCAYCHIEAYQVLEHYVPITKGGGTTKENCVPACVSCNAKKRDKHPDIPEDHRDDWERQTVYLPPDLKKWLKLQRIEQGRSMSEITAQILEEYRQARF